MKVKVPDYAASERQAVFHQSNELREKIDDYIDRFRMQWKVKGDEYHQSELIEDIVQLIIQYRKAYGKKIIDRLEKAYDAALYDVHELDLTEYLYAGEFHDAIRSERKRNQGEKTDE